MNQGNCKVSTKRFRSESKVQSMEKQIPDHILKKNIVVVKISTVRNNIANLYKFRQMIIIFEIFYFVRYLILWILLKILYFTMPIFLKGFKKYYSIFRIILVQTDYVGMVFLLGNYFIFTWQ